MSIVYFTKLWPRRNFNSQLQRSISLTETIINANRELVLCSPDLNNQSKKILVDYPMSLVDINPQKTIASLLKAKLNPNFFLFDSIETQENYSALLYNKWNKCPRILDLSTLTKLQSWRKTNYHLLPGFLNPKDSFMTPQDCEEIFSENELRAINRSDFVITANQFIYFILKNILKMKNCAHIGFGFPNLQFYSQVKNLEFRPFRNRQNFVFYGNFDKPAVKQSLNCLITFIWPMIRKQLPDQKLYIYGTGRNQFLFKNKNKLEKQGIIFVGILEDTEDLSKFIALLYPNIYSVGLRIKILQSWFNHLPVVTTPIGAEGLFLEALEPQNMSSQNNITTVAFNKERKVSEKQIVQSQKIQNYYSSRKINQVISDFQFGGSCANFSYQQFADSAVRMCNDEIYWNKCLSIGHKTINLKQDDGQIVNNLKTALVQVEIAAFEGRTKNTYIEEWKKYSRSVQFQKKINQR